MKKILGLILIFSVLQEFALPVFADVWKGHAEITDTPDTSKQEKIFTGKKDKIESKDVVKMVVSQVLQGGTTMEGDEFFAEISNNVEGNGGILLPIGTIAHGTVRNITDEKRGGRDGWIEVKFDSLITPDGREIPIDATMTTKNSAPKAVAKAIGIDTAYTVTGSLVGGVTALNLLGLEAAIASHGYTIMGGLAAGAVMGLGLSLIRKGKGVLISRGDEIKVVIQSDIELPVMHKDAFKQEEILYDGLDVNIKDIWLVKDPFGIRNTLQLTMDITNTSEQDFSAFDIAVVNDMQRKFYPSLFYKDAMPFSKMKRGTKVSGKLYFAVDDPKRAHWLVFYDRVTRKPLAKISIENVKQQLHVDFSKKRNKKSK
ncbi:TrbI/VirB10 family protein [bacterium]|nr:TrbI/VirB10 family protein [bacterium]